MKTGLLWFDDDSHKTLEEKVQKAATHYGRKHNRPPNMCFVHPSALDGDGKQLVRKAGDVEIRTSCSVLPSHFWLGITDKADQSKITKRSTTI